MNEFPRITDPITRLRAYGVQEWRVQLCMDILSKASTPEEVDKELGELHSSIDGAQFLMPAFRPLYQTEPDIRDRVQQELVGTGVPPAIIDEYLVESGDQPYLVFHLRHEQDIPLTAREGFNQAAAQVVLNTLKTYLGLMPPQNQP